MGAPGGQDIAIERASALTVEVLSEKAALRCTRPVALDGAM